MSNQGSRLSRNFIRQVVKYYNDNPTLIEPYKCSMCGYKYNTDTNDPKCPKCDEKRMKIIYART